MQRRIFFLVACLAWSGCNKRDADQSKPPAESRTAGTLASDTTPKNTEASLRYPSGPWWRGDMMNLYVSAAHILVTHRNVEPWSAIPGEARSERSRDEALTKVRALQAQLARDPTRFEALAASESDDTMSARLGGMIGTVRAARVPPEFVDALGHLEPSEISQVVESGAGFHLIRRLAPPPNEPRSFAHIVLKFDGAAGWNRTDRLVPKRGIEEARSLAQKVADEAKRDPSRFAELVQQYSDADDVLRNGDLGALTPYDPYGLDLSLFTHMSRLEIGEVSDVLAGSMGFEIVQRMPDVERELRAASVITLGYRGAQSNIVEPSTRAREKAEKTASALLRELRANPGLFAQRRTEYCDLYQCEKPVRWRRGRELSALDVTVGKLKIGELARADSPLGLLIVRREDPTAFEAPSPEPMTEFPTEPLAAVAQAAAAPPPGAPENEVQLIAQLAEEAVRTLELKGEKANGFYSIFAELTSRIQARPDAEFVDDDAAWADAQVLALLGEDKNEEFVRFRRLFFARTP